jgi:hypothetical protein
LKSETDKPPDSTQLAKKLEGIVAAIAALGGRRKKTRRMSAAVRRKIRATQKKNWAKKLRKACGASAGVLRLFSLHYFGANFHRLFHQTEQKHCNFPPFQAI